MFGFKKIGQFALGMTAAVVFDEDGNGNPIKSAEDDSQLDALSDGLNSVIADGDHFMQHEAEEAQSRGELYNTFL